MVKKRTKKRTQKRTHFFGSLSRKQVCLYSGIVFVLFVLISTSIYGAVQLVTSQRDAARLSRIEAIYGSLDLGDSYRVVKADIFGDKRVYEWDSGRTYSSSVEFGHNDTQMNTFADLKAKIEAAGFAYFEQDYGGVALQYHFKSANGEYIRVQVEPKAWQDSMVYGTPSLDELSTADIDTAPVYVTIKVNLDDNNE